MGDVSLYRALPWLRKTLFSLARDAAADHTPLDEGGAEESLIGSCIGFISYEILCLDGEKRYFMESELMKVK